MDLLSKEPSRLGEVGVVFSPALYTQQEHSSEDPPSFSIVKIRKAAGKYMDVLSKYLNDVLAGEVLYRLIDDVCLLIDYPVEKNKTVLNSLQEFLGNKLTARVLWRICFKINANKDYILRDIALPEWEADSTKAIWAPMHIINVERPQLIHSEKQLLRIYALIMDSPAAGVVMTQQLPVKYIRWFLKEIGYPRYDPVSEWEAYNSWFTAQLGRTAQQKTAMIKFCANSAQKKHNRELHKHREDCPKQMPWFCDRCPYGIDKCLFAVKRESWPHGTCANGHPGYFRPRRDGTVGEYCMRCSFLNKQNKEVVNGN